VLLPILLEKLTGRQGLRDWLGRDGERRQAEIFAFTRRQARGRRIGQRLTDSDD
jgi:hypothetical protein